MSDTVRFPAAPVEPSPLHDVLESAETFANWSTEPTWLDEDVVEDEIRLAAQHVAKLVEPVDLNEIARLCHGCDEGMGRVEHGCQAEQPSASEMLAAIHRALASKGLVGQHRIASWEKAERYLAVLRSVSDRPEWVKANVEPEADRAYRELTEAEQHRCRWIVRDAALWSDRSFVAVNGHERVARTELEIALFRWRADADAHQAPGLGRRVLETLVLDADDPRLK